MEEILGAFGVDAKLIVIQIFNFGLLLAALWYFLYTPILKVLSERQEKIVKGVEDAERAEEALQNAELKKGTILSDAHHEAERIVEHAKSHAIKKESEILEDASKKVETIVQNAEKQGAEIQDRVKKEAEAEVAKAAVLAAEQILRERA